MLAVAVSFSFITLIRRFCYYTSEALCSSRHNTTASFVSFVMTTRPSFRIQILTCIFHHDQKLDHLLKCRPTLTSNKQGQLESSWRQQHNIIKNAVALSADAEPPSNALVAEGLNLPYIIRGAWSDRGCDIRVANPVRRSHKKCVSVSYSESGVRTGM